MKLSEHRKKMVETVQPYQDRIAKLETANAELIEALEGLLLLIEHETDLPKSAANGNVGPSGWPDEGIVHATKIMASAEQAIRKHKGEGK